jgi:hypothetical protein
LGDLRAALQATVITFPVLLVLKPRIGSSTVPYLLLIGDKGGVAKVVPAFHMLLQAALVRSTSRAK